MKTVQLNYQNGEKFLVQLKQLLKEQDITLMPVNRRKDKFGFNDGIWRGARHFDTTCTNISELSDVYYRLGLLIDVTNNSHVNGVKWSWSLNKSYKKKKGKFIILKERQTCFHLKRESLDEVLFPKLKEILTQMNLHVHKMECESLGGYHKTIYVEVTVADQDVLARHNDEMEKRNNQYLEMNSRPPEVITIGEIKEIKTEEPFLIENDSLEFVVFLLESQFAKKEFDKSRIKDILQTHLKLAA